MILLQLVICKNATHSTAFCQSKFNIEAFHVKHRMYNVYMGLKSSGRSTQKSGCGLHLQVIADSHTQESRITS